MFDLNKKVALVVGGAGYFGQTICRKLAEQGAWIIIADLNIDKAKEIADSIASSCSKTSCVGIHINMAEEESITKAVAQTVKIFGKIDILINLSYAATGKSVEDITMDQLDATLHINLAGAFILLKASSNYFSESASIIMFSSMYGHVAPDPRVYPPPMTPNPIDYGIAKAGIEQMVRYLAVYWGSRKIRVNAIAPGPFPNDSNPLYRNNPDYEAFKSRLNQKTPLGRIGNPDELTGAVVFLASNESSYMTGQVLNIDGGWTCW